MYLLVNPKGIPDMKLPAIIPQVQVNTSGFLYSVLSFIFIVIFLSLFFTFFIKH